MIVFIRKDVPYILERGNMARKVEPGVWIFYAVFVLAVLFEATIVRVLGLWLGGGVLLVGGAVLGMLELYTTKPSGKANDPFFRAGLWLDRKNTILGFVMMAIFFGGAPGTAVLYKKKGHSNAFVLTMLAAILFAGFWAPVFHLID